MQEDRMRSRFYLIFAVGIFGLTMAGCRPKAPIAKEPAVTEDAQKAAEEPSLRGKEYKEVPELVTVYFDLDQSSLRSDAREILQKNYDALRDHKDWEVLVEGNCD